MTQKLHAATRSLPLLAALALALSTVACGAAASAIGERPADLVPTGAVLIGNFHVAQILDDPEVRSLYAMGAESEDGPATVDELLSEIERKTGVDIGQLDEIVFFVDGQDEPTEGGLIAPGNFDRDALFDAIRTESDVPWEELSHRGQVLLTSSNVHASIAAVTVLEGEVLVAGTLASVQRVVDVHVGEREHLTGPVRDLYDALEDGWLRLATVPRTSSPGVLPEGFDDFPFELEALGAANLFGLTVDKQGEAVATDAILAFADDALAAEAAELLDAAITLLGAFGPDELDELLDGVTVTADGSDVKIAVQMTVEQLRTLFESAEGSPFSDFSS